MSTHSASEIVEFFAGDTYDPDTKGKIAVFLAPYLAAKPRLAALELGSVPNALVLPAGGRK